MKIDLKNIEFTWSILLGLAVLFSVIAGIGIDFKIATLTFPGITGVVGVGIGSFAKALIESD